MFFTEFDQFFSSVPEMKPDFEETFFKIYTEDKKGFIQPSFKPIFPEVTAPQILLVSAHGAAGKSTLARHVSFSHHIPLWDLALSKPIADNSITGLVSTFYESKFLEMLPGLQRGEQCILMDGLDEARSKTSEKGFEAFLDDMSKLSKKGVKPVFVVFGRNRSIEDAWSYLVGKSINVQLLVINPFTTSDAERYIDNIALNTNATSHRKEYEEAKKLIFSKLRKSFRTGKEQESFLNFIGYPPVLEAIGVLLAEERNYIRLIQELQGETEGDHEVNLLIRICEYILTREKSEKVLPNVLSEIITRAQPRDREMMTQEVYSVEDQCERIASTLAGHEFINHHIPDLALRAAFEDGIQSFFTEHPFLIGHKMKSPVFDAYVFSVLASGNCDSELLRLFADILQPNNFVLSFLRVLVAGRKIRPDILGYLVDCTTEISGYGFKTTVSIESQSYNDFIEDKVTDSELEISVREKETQQELFSFRADISASNTISIKDSIEDLLIVVPCDIRISSGMQFIANGFNSISARMVSLSMNELIVGTTRDESSSPCLLIEAEEVRADVRTVYANGELGITIHGDTVLGYPLVAFTKKEDLDLPDEAIKRKYLRLRRILSEFRSHSKGQLAKYKEKIENRRVLKDTNGEKVLAALVGSGVLYLEYPMYIINEARIHEVLGVNWLDLRKGNRNPKLINFLRGIG